MTLLEITQEIINKHDFEIRSTRGFLGINKITNIKLRERSAVGLFSELFNAACEILGSPMYVHSYYGYIWKKDGKFLAYNDIEESYNCNAINFFIFDKLPCGNKLNYGDYIQIVETVRQIFADHSLSFSGDVHYHDNAFCFLAENNEAQCLLLIKRRSLFFGYSKKQALENGMTRIIPNYTRNIKIHLQSASAIKQALESCFVSK